MVGAASATAAAPAWAGTAAGCTAGMLPAALTPSARCRRSAVRAWSKVRRAVYSEVRVLARPRST
jgi:hypothetical protein